MNMETTIYIDSQNGRNSYEQEHIGAGAGSKDNAKGSESKGCPKRSESIEQRFHKYHEEKPTKAAPTLDYFEEEIELDLLNMEVFKVVGAEEHTRDTQITHTSTPKTDKSSSSSREIGDKKSQVHSSKDSPELRNERKSSESSRRYTKDGSRGSENYCHRYNTRHNQRKGHSETLVDEQYSARLVSQRIKYSKKIKKCKQSLEYFIQKGKAEEDAVDSKREVGKCKQVNEVSQQVNGVAQQVSEVSQQVSRVAQQASKMSQQMSEVPQQMQKVSHQVSEVSQQASEVPQKASKVPQKARKVPQKARKVPQKVRKVPQRARKVLQQASEESKGENEEVIKVSKGVIKVSMEANEESKKESEEVIEVSMEANEESKGESEEVIEVPMEANEESKGESEEVIEVSMEANEESKGESEEVIEVSMEANEESKGESEEVIEVPMEANEESKGESEEVIEVPMEANEKSKGESEEVIEVSMKANEESKGESEEVIEVPMEANEESKGESEEVIEVSMEANEESKGESVEVIEVSMEANEESKGESEEVIEVPMEANEESKGESEEVIEVSMEANEESKGESEEVIEVSMEANEESKGESEEVIEVSMEASEESQQESLDHKKENAELKADIDSVQDDSMSKCKTGISKIGNFIQELKTRDSEDKDGKLKMDSEGSKKEDIIFIKAVKTNKTSEGVEQNDRISLNKAKDSRLGKSKKSKQEDFKHPENKDGKLKMDIEGSKKEDIIFIKAVKTNKTSEGVEQNDRISLNKAKDSRLGKSKKSNQEERKLHKDDMEEDKKTTLKIKLSREQENIDFKSKKEIKDARKNSSTLQNDPCDMEEMIDKYLESIRKEYSTTTTTKEHVPDNDEVCKKVPVIGEPHMYRFSKVVIIGDSRIKPLEDVGMKSTFGPLEIKCVPDLTFDNLKEAVKHNVDKSNCPRGILLICSVGIYDMIELNNNVSCEKMLDHEPMKQISDTQHSMKNKNHFSFWVNLRTDLKKLFCKNSMIFFTTILPVHISKFNKCQAQAHKMATGHNPGYSKKKRKLWTSKMMNIDFSVNSEVSKFNSHVSVLSVRGDRKTIIFNLLPNVREDGQIFFANSLPPNPHYNIDDGLNPSRDATQNYMVPMLKYTIKQYHMNRYQEVVLIGDSRLQKVEKGWHKCDGEMITIFTQCKLSFRALTEDNPIVKEISGKKDALIVLSLGMYDIINFVAEDGCDSHKMKLELPSLCFENLDSSDKLWNDFVNSLKSVDELLRKVTTNCDVIITTIYPFDFLTLQNYLVKRHAEETGHIVTIPSQSMEIKEKLNRIEDFMLIVNKFAFTLAEEKQLPVWDFNSLVFSAYKSANYVPLFDGFHPTAFVARRIAKACVKLADNSLYVCCSNFSIVEMEDEAEFDKKLHMRQPDLSTVLEIFDVSVSPICNETVVKRKWKNTENDSNVIVTMSECEPSAAGEDTLAVNVNKIKDCICPGALSSKIKNCVREKREDNLERENSVSQNPLFDPFSPSSLQLPSLDNEEKDSEFHGEETGSFKKYKLAGNYTVNYTESNFSCSQNSTPDLRPTIYFSQPKSSEGVSKSYSPSIGYNPERQYSPERENNPKRVTSSWSYGSRINHCSGDRSYSAGSSNYDKSLSSPERIRRERCHTPVKQYPLDRDGTWRQSPSRSSSRGEIGRQSPRRSCSRDKIGRQSPRRSCSRDKIGRQSPRRSCSRDKIWRQSPRRSCSNDKIGRQSPRRSCSRDKIGKQSPRRSCSRDKIWRQSPRRSSSRDKIGRQSPRRSCSRDKIWRQSPRRSCSREKIWRQSPSRSCSRDETWRKSPRRSCSSDETWRKIPRRSCSRDETWRKSPRRSCSRDETWRKSPRRRSCSPVQHYAHSSSDQVSSEHLRKDRHHSPWKREMHSPSLSPHSKRSRSRSISRSHAHSSKGRREERGLNRGREERGLKRGREERGLKRGRRKKRGSEHSVIVCALHSLREVHNRECDKYRKKPFAHPDYTKEYQKFVDKKRERILSLGGDPSTYDTTKEWEIFWQSRMETIFNECWTVKRDQCVSMLPVNKSFSHSPSPSSSCSVSSDRSSDTSNYNFSNILGKKAKCSRSPSIDRKKNVKEVKISRERKISNRIKYFQDKGVQEEEKIDPKHRDFIRKGKSLKCSSSETFWDNGFLAGEKGSSCVAEKLGMKNMEGNINELLQVIEPVKSVEHIAGNTANSFVTELIPYISNDAKQPFDRNIMAESCEKITLMARLSKKTSCRLQDSLKTSGVSFPEKEEQLKLNTTRQLPEVEVSSTTLTGCFTAEVIDVLELLSHVGERLGALQSPVKLLHEQALMFKSSGLDAIKIFDEIDNKILLNMIVDKLRKALKDGTLNIIHKIITREAEEKLSLLLEKEKDRSLLHDLNVDSIANACLGKSSAETTTFIENALMYLGHTKVPQDQLMRIHMAVKTEQAKIFSLSKNVPQGRDCVVSKPLQIPVPPGKPSHHDAVPISQQYTSVPPPSLGSATYSQSHIRNLCLPFPVAPGQEAVPKPVHTISQAPPQPIASTSQTAPHTIASTLQMIPQPVPPPVIMPGSHTFGSSTHTARTVVSDKLSLTDFLSSIVHIS
ncbi:uncharacterized protein [Procambarus clarkii]|uniref:uncharacterized protein isoform X1 n=2 Tax=Procambarus clarkii TaxID=6728 RepID=UPI0037446788